MVMTGAETDRAVKRGLIMLPRAGSLWCALIPAIVMTLFTPAPELDQLPSPMEVTPMWRRNTFRTLAALASATVALSAAVAAPAHADAVPSPIVKHFCSIAGIEWTGGIEG